MPSQGVRGGLWGDTFLLPPLWLFWEAEIRFPGLHSNHLYLSLLSRDSTSFSHCLPLSTISSFWDPSVITLFS